MALGLSVILSGPVARRLRAHRAIGWLLLVSFGGILAMTLTPSPAALAFGTHGTVGCDLSRIGPAPLAVYLRRDDPILNVILFMPLGIAIGMLPPSRLRVVVIVAALLLSPAIELVQAVAVALDRACQGGDVFDNIAGLCLGILIGGVVRVIWTHGWPAPRSPGTMPRKGRRSRPGPRSGGSSGPDVMSGPLR